MRIPVPPAENKMVDGKGYVTTPWRNYFNQISQQLRSFVNDEGYLMPSMKKDKLKTIEETKIKALAYNETSEKSVANNAGKFEEIQTAPELTSNEITEYAKRAKKSWLVFDTDNTELKKYDKTSGTYKEIETV